MYSQSTGLPLVADIELFDATCDTSVDFIPGSSLDAASDFSFTGLAPGAYKISYRSADPTVNAVFPYWATGETCSTASIVTLTAGQSLNLGHVVIPAGATISGTVSTYAGRAPGEGFVDLLDLNGNVIESTIADVYTGTFSLASISPGTYKLYFYDGSGLGSELVPQYWEGEDSLSDATVLSITAQQAITGINVVLQQSPSISGVVSYFNGSTSVPLVGNVSVWDSTGGYVGSTTIDDGQYTFYVVTPGTYYLDFGPSTSYLPETNIASEWYGGTAVRGESTSVTVGVGQQVTGIDQTLVAGASISGSIGSTYVESNGLDPTMLDAWIYVMDTTTGDDVLETIAAVDENTGTYEAYNLPPGNYSVAFKDDTTGGRGTPSYWEGQSTAATATRIVVVGGETVTGIDGTVGPGGTISGAITLPGGTQSITDVADGDVFVELETYQDGSWAPESDTSSYDVIYKYGYFQYSIPGLVPGQYKVALVYSSGALFGVSETPSPVTVVGGQTTDVPLGVTPVMVLASGTLVRTASNPTIYLVDGESNFIPITSFDVVSDMGLSTSFKVVPDDAVIPDSTNENTLSSTPLTSVISCYGTYFMTGSGKRWEIAASLVANLQVTPLFEDTCDQIPLSPTTINRALFVKSASSPTIWYVTPAGEKSAMPSFAAMQALSAPDAPVYLTVADSFLASLPVGPDTVTPGELVKTASSPAVYLVDGTSSLVPVASFDSVSAMGLPISYTTVSAATISAKTIATSPLSAIVSCSGSDFIAGSGKLWPIASGLVGSLPVTTLDPTTCAAAPQGSPGFVRAAFVKSASSAAIYWINSNGQKVPMSSFAQMATLSAPDPVNYITVAASFLASLPIGPMPVTPGELIKGSGPAIYLVDGANGLVPVAAFDEASAMGLSTAFATVSQSTIATRTLASAPLGTFISCSGSDYVAGSGKLWPIASALVGSLPVTVLDPTTCAVAPKSSQGINNALFVKSASASAIYLVDATGHKDQVHSFATITQLSAPDPANYLTVAAGFIASLPSGPDIFPAGSLVKSSSAPAIYLVDGSGGLIPVASFGTVSDMGLSTAFSIVSPASIANVASSALSDIVSCAGTDYIAGSGKLWPISSAAVGSLTVSVLPSTLCSAIPTSSAALSPVLIRSATTGAIYNLVGGQKTALTLAQFTHLPVQPPIYVNVNDWYLAMIPAAPTT